MTEPVVLSDELIEELRREAEKQDRSVSEQLEYWIRFGKAVAKYDLFMSDVGIFPRPKTAAVMRWSKEKWGRLDGPRGGMDTGVNEKRADSDPARRGSKPYRVSSNVSFDSETCPH